MTIRYENDDAPEIRPSSPIKEHESNIADILLKRRYFIALSLGLSIPAWGHDFQGETIHVGHPWAYPTPGSDAAVVFLALVNRGREPDRLVGAESPRARRAVLLEYPPNAGTVRLVTYFDLPPNAPLALRPGRRHIRLQQLDRPFVIGERVPLTLIFARAGRMTVEVMVENDGSH